MKDTMSDVGSHLFRDIPELNQIVYTNIDLLYTKKIQDIHKIPRGGGHPAPRDRATVCLLKLVDELV